MPEREDYYISYLLCIKVLVLLVAGVPAKNVLIQYFIQTTTPQDAVLILE
jgi:hypothetical protein